MGTGQVGPSGRTSGGGGVTNSAGANVVTKSDGTNLVASSITDNGTTVTTTEPIVQTSASASALVSGPNGATNPVLKVDNSTASQKDGVSITGGASGAGATIGAVSDGADSPINLRPKGAGSFAILRGSDGTQLFATTDNFFFSTSFLLQAKANSYLALANNFGNPSSSAILIGGDNSGPTLGTPADRDMVGLMTGVVVRSGDAFKFSSSASVPYSSDTFFKRRAAATFQFGDADAASPVAQTLSVQNVAAGTSNTAGTDFSISGSQGTGTGAGGSIIFKTAPAGSTGTAQNALASALTIGSDGSLAVQKTITAGGTTGAQTINKPAGTVNFAASATSLVVTNSLVTANSIIIATVGTNDTTMKSVQAVAGSGSFTLYANAAATSETRVNFLVIN